MQPPKAGLETCLHRPHAGLCLGKSLASFSACRNNVIVCNNNSIGRRLMVSTPVTRHSPPTNQLVCDCGLLT